MSDVGSTMTMVEHLEELRRRLIVVLAAGGIAAVLGFVVSGSVIDLLRTPLPEKYATLYFTGPAGAFGAQLKIAGFLGIALAMPVVLFEAWRFITPGLTSRERRLVWPLLLAATLLFVLGVAVGFAIIPYALTFLLGFAREGVQPLLTIDDYIGFVTTLLLVFGLVMEFPIVLVALARIGMLSHARLAQQRRWAILGIVLFAIVATPGGDPISPTILSGLMYLLFEGTLLVIRLMRR